MATQKEESHTGLLVTTIEHNDCSNTPFSKEHLLQPINTVVAYTEDEDRDAKHNTNNVTTDTFIQPPSRRIHQERKQTMQIRCEFFRTV